MRILRLLHTAKEIQVLSLKLLIQQSARYWNKQQIKIQTQGSLTTNHTSVLQLINTMWLYSESQLSNALFSQYFLRSVWELCHVTNSSVELGDNRNRASHTLQSEGAGKARWSPVCLSCHISSQTLWETPRSLGWRMRRERAGAEVGSVTHPQHCRQSMQLLRS